METLNPQAFKLFNSPEIKTVEWAILLAINQFHNRPIVQQVAGGTRSFATLRMTKAATLNTGLYSPAK